MSIDGTTGKYGTFDATTDYKKNNTAAKYGANAANNVTLAKEAVNKYRTAVSNKNFTEAASLYAAKEKGLNDLTSIKYASAGADQSIFIQSLMGYAAESMKGLDSFDGKSISNTDAGYSFLAIEKNGKAEDAANGLFERLKVLSGSKGSYADVNGDGKLDDKDLADIKTKIDTDNDGIISDAEAAKVGEMFDKDKNGRVEIGEYAADVMVTDGVNDGKIDGIITADEQNTMNASRAAELVGSKSYEWGNWSTDSIEKAYNSNNLGEAQNIFLAQQAQEVPATDKVEQPAASQEPEKEEKPAEPDSVLVDKWGTGNNDSLWNIVKNYYGLSDSKEINSKINDIVKYNNDYASQHEGIEVIKDKNVIRAGQKIILPPKQ